MSPFATPIPSVCPSVRLSVGEKLEHCEDGER